MKTITRSAAIAVAFALAAVALLATSAQAAPKPAAVTWSVAPAAAHGSDSRDVFAYSVKPGVEIRDYVAVSNDSSTSTTFNVYATSAENDPKTGALSLFESGQKAVDLGSWITLPVKTITIAGGAQARIPVTILVPSDASPGDHTAGVIASIFKNSKKSHGRAIRLEERIGVPVYVHVAGKEVAGASVSGLVSGFNPSLNPFGGGDSSASYSVQNTGNVRVDVTQKVTISGPFGIVLGHATGERIHDLLPGESVQEQFQQAGIAPLILVWSNISVTTAKPTDEIIAGTTRSDSGATVPAAKFPKASTATGSTLTGAIPWTLLGLLLIVIIAIWLLVRYIGASRDRVYLAIDAAAKEAREKALAEETAKRAKEARVKEPVA